MDGRARTFLLLQVLFCFIVLASTEETKQNCSQVQCPGPLVFYHDMGCTPVYKNEGDCCAYKYNCDHLHARSPNKCYIRNNSYEIGEIANRDDIKLCDLTCICATKNNSTGFWCFYKDYAYGSSIGPSCYLERNIRECGPGRPICLRNESDVPRCVVDGRTYMAGEPFRPASEPYKFCICQEGYTGDNNEPFCTTPSMRCSPHLYSNEDIANKNAPVYKWNEREDISCLLYWRHQNAEDAVIPNPNGPNPSEEKSSGGEDLTCKFGNLTMNIGDELNQNTAYDSICLRCVCEVPPIPTCKYLNRQECIAAMNS